jgi:chromosome segregation protein
VTAAQDADTQAAGLEQQLSSTGDTLAGLRQRRAELNAALSEQQQAISELVAQLSHQEQDEVALSAQRERAVERVSEWLAILEERYSLTLSQLLSDPHITAPPPGAVIDASEAGRGKLRDEKARLSAGLAGIGDVNLLAIEQHQQHSKRLAFLDGQADELMRAAADLDALVGDLDQTTEKRYRDNLRRIEQRFNEIFLDLFGSGWARLHFEDPEAIIDSGVEVQVQLPAARRHSLRSLSGGQRSLIFLALFFAVHSVRSPGFCILDEADAALDDANVERFQKLIRRGAGEEQFIIITHNKRTMETADKLVGVVGKPKGISNLLSVDIKQARKMVERVGA